MDHKRTLRAVYNGVILLLLIGGAYLVIDRFVHFGNVEFTDNATVRQYITPVDTRVQGFIREIRFEEYQPVHKGDTLVIIEDAEFRLRLAQAKALHDTLEEYSKAQMDFPALTEYTAQYIGEIFE